MKRIVTLIAAAVISLNLLPGHAFAAELLIPVGKVVGLALQDDRVTIAGFDDALGTAARDAGLKVGDEILKINDTSISSAEDVRTALAQCGSQVQLLIDRGGKQHRVTLTTRSTGEGPRLGIYLRQGIAGIGTVTYYDPDTGCFGALGHGVSSSQGDLLEMTRGSACTGRILSVKKGTCGQPGQLRGSADSASIVGILEKNTPQGVFGKASLRWLGQPIPAAAFEEITTGEAVILSTIAGDSPREYSVEILKIYPKDRPDCRNFLLKVTDPALLETTGGIVQGMSGSPIIQKGRLVGAVTHVLVNDPTTGYGIFIENMLDAAA